MVLRILADDRQRIGRRPMPAGGTMRRRPSGGMPPALVLLLTSEARRARPPALRPPLVRSGAHGHMGLQEAAHPVDCTLLQLFRFLPRVHGNLSVRR